MDPLAAQPQRELDEEFARRSIDLAVRSVASGGGPFGALVVRDGTVIATAHNRVRLDCDPTAHAEILALRLAARTRGTHDLSGCVLYASAEPCPMCQGAALWARLERVVFAADRQLAARAGFDDREFHDLVGSGRIDQRLRTTRAAVERAGAPFAAWLAKSDRAPY